jgi:hypothetical protein
VTQAIAAEASATVTVPGGAEVQVPAGAFSTAVTLTIQSYGSDPVTAPNAASFSVSGSVFEIDAGGTEPSQPVTLTFPYTPVAGQTPEVAYTEDDGSTWTELTGTVDTLTDPATISVSVSSFSYWGVVFNAATPTETPTFTLTPTNASTPTAAPTFPTYTPVPGASTLNPGDVAFTAYTDTASGKQFSFMLMKAVTQGTTISISNANWNGSVLSSTTTKYITWIADQAYPAGTTVIYTRVGGNGVGVNIGYVEDGGNGGSGIGWSSPKLLTAFQGTPASPTFITAMLLGQTWGGSAATSVPTGLSDGSTAIAFATFEDWAAFDNNCSPISSPSGTEAQLDAMINADPSGIPTNWSVDTSDTTDSLSASSSPNPWLPCTLSFTGGPSATPSPNYSPTGTSTISPTYTVSPFETPTPTSTDTPIESPTPTDTPSQTPSASPTASIAGTTLQAGDAMIVGLSSDSTPGKQIAFMLLKGVAAGTQIGIDNGGWTSTAFTSQSPTKSYVVWQADQAYPAGTTVIYSRPGGDTSAVDKGFIVAGEGASDGVGFSSPKLLVLFQGPGTNPVTNPTLLNAVLMGSTWGANGSPANVVPANSNGSLADGQTAVQFSTYPDWAGYQCVATSGSEVEIDAAIDTDPFALPTNWSIDASDNSDTLESHSPPWEPCSGQASSGVVAYTPPQPPKPQVGPVPQHSGQDVYFAPMEDAASSQFWVYSLTGRLVSTLSFGGAGSGEMPSWIWTTHGVAPGIYRVKTVVDYENGTTYKGWLTIAIVP